MCLVASPSEFGSVSVSMKVDFTVPFHVMLLHQVELGVFRPTSISLRVVSLRPWMELRCVKLKGQKDHKIR